MTWYKLIISFDILLGLSAISIRNDCSLNSPCMNLAKCTYQDGMKCLCSRGFSGNLCEIWPRECSSDFCLNQGTCVLSRQIPRCICQEGFSGIFCEKSQITTLATTYVSSSPPTTSTTTPITSTLGAIWTTEHIAQTIQVNTTSLSTENLEELTTSEIRSRKNSSQGAVKSGHVKNSICDYHPCLNKAECIALNDTEFKFYCVCPENYAGLLCEQLLAQTATTTSTSAMKEKLSEIEELNFLPTPVIADSEDWKSTKQNVFIITDKTDTRKSFCAQMRPCANNAQCVDLEPTVQDPRTFMCLCSNDYTGTFCHIEKKVSLCSKNPCFNSGTCLPSSDQMSYTCECQKGFSGHHCELKNA